MTEKNHIKHRDQVDDAIRGRMNKDMHRLLVEFKNDPVGTRASLRQELGYPERDAGELFAIVVLLCDDYLSLAPTGAS